MHPQNLLEFLALLLLPLVISVGIWTTLNPNDPLVIVIGQFAVTEYNKETPSKLFFQSVVSGRTLPRGTGLWYDLVIAAKDASSPISAKYQASIWERSFLPSEFHGLRKFSQ